MNSREWASALKLLAGLILLFLILGEGTWLLPPKIANLPGMVWPGGMPDHINYAGQTHSGPTVCLPPEQVKQADLVQIGSAPTLFGDSHPLLLPRNQVPNKDHVKTTYVQTATGCYVAYSIQNGS